jgi:flagellar basal body-associated protein FliL
MLIIILFKSGITGIKSMSAGIGTYEVRVLRKGEWLTESRGPDEGAAMTSANKFAADRTNEGVKVVEESYDEDTGSFREKTVFSYFNQNDKVEAGERAAIMLAAARVKRMAGGKNSAGASTDPLAKKKSRSYMMIAAVVFGIVGNLIFAILLGDKFGIDIQSLTASMKPAPKTEQKTLVYDLPEITANIRSGDEERVIHIRVGLQLKNRGQNAELERKLTDIVSRMASDLNQFDTKDQKLDIQDLRKSLQKGVQSSGNTEIEGLLFKELHIF